MLEQLFPLQLPPGFRNTGTTYQAKGRWNVGDRVRFFQDTIQPVGGWVQRTLTGAAITGVPNACVSWTDNAGATWIAIGTTAGLFVIASTNEVSNITPGAWASDPNMVWQLANFGSYLVAVNGIKDPSSGSGGNVWVWTGDPNTPANYAGGSLSGDPVNVNGCFVTAERFLMVLQGDPPGVTFKTGHVDTGISIRRVIWPDQETVTVWTASDTNQAGFQDLGTDGYLVCGAQTTGVALIWTTTDLWRMTYIGGTYVYSFQKAGGHCGIVSAHAFAVVDAAAFWMGTAGFYMYDGFVKPIPCEVQDYVFGNLTATYRHRIWALNNSAFGEVTWFYPSSAATTCDRYVTYSYRENHWTFGTLNRSTGLSYPANGSVPFLVDESGNVYDHETGTTMDATTPYLESGPVEVGNGDRVVRVQRIVPDDKTLGDVNVTLYGSFYPDASETAYGPYTLADPTSVRMTARQVRVKITQAQANSWRVGVIRLGGILGGRR